MRKFGVAADTPANALKCTHRMRVCSTLLYSCIQCTAYPCAKRSWLKLFHQKISAISAFRDPATDELQIRQTTQF